MTLFRGFDENFIRLLDLFFEEGNAEASTLLIEQGQLQNRFFIMVAGEAEVFHVVEDRKVPLDIITAGQFFGEMNLFDPGIATASVVSLTKVQTLEISNDKFRHLINYKPELAADFTFQLAQVIVRRFRGSREKLLNELVKPGPTSSEALTTTQGC